MAVGQGAAARLSHAAVAVSAIGIGSTAVAVRLNVSRNPVVGPEAAIKNESGVDATDGATEGAGVGSLAGSST